ncbi:MAG TPA: hypothetical protein EYG89_05510 [Bacteroidia bacterium]|nr:hypothetical protein [Bacteroidia bacterium]
MKKLLIFSIIFLSLVGTNCNAEIRNIQVEVKFKGSLIVGNECIDFYKIVEDEDEYLLESFKKDDKEIFIIPIVKVFKIYELPKDPLSKLSKLLCFKRR